MRALERKWLRQEVAERTSGSRGHREKGRRTCGLGAQPEALVDSAACYVGGYSAPPVLGIPALGGQLTDPACSCRATYSGEDSGVRLDISSGVGTVHTGRTEREGVVTTMPSPQALHCGVLCSTHILFTGAFLCGPWEPWDIGSCPGLWC